MADRTKLLAVGVFCAIGFVCYWHATSDSVTFLKERGAFVSHERWAGCVISTTVKWNTGTLVDADLEHLSSAHNLTMLDISGNPMITDDGLHRLSLLNYDLVLLNLSGTSVTNGGMHNFQQKQRNCRIEMDRKQGTTAH